MAQTSVKLYAIRWGYVDSNYPVDVIDLTHMNYEQVREKKKILYVEFEQFPAALQHKVLYYAKIKVAASGSSSSRKLYANPLKSKFDETTLTYNNRPDYEFREISSSSYITSTSTSDYELVPSAGASATIMSEGAMLFLKTSSVQLTEIYGYTSITIKLRTLTDGTSIPYLEIFYDDTESVESVISITNAPTSGYVNPRTATSFSWQYIKDPESEYYACEEEFEQSSATFYWKKAEDATYTAVQISGSTKGITIPANTFPTGKTISWYVEGTDDGGTTSQTSVYSFSTAAGAVTSTPAAPINTIESNNEEITFEWSYASADGFPPSRYVLEWRVTGEQQWNELIDSTTIVTSYTAPANTFPAGEIQWCVLPYNIDGVAGTGTVASFISFGAPPAPSVTATEVPYLTVSWQAADQQAYKITVDDKVYGPYFGTEKRFELPEYLEDGTHTIAVNIMGNYALWSQAGSVTVTIANDPGDDIELEVEDGIEPKLVWTTEEATGDFYVYRNGKVIGHTAEQIFEDRFAEGQNSYQVVNKLPSGNYSISGEETGTVHTGGTCIADLEDGDWIQIDYSRADQRDPEFSEEVETAYNHLAGYAFPSAVIGSYQNTSMSFSALFLAEQTLEQNAFRSLFGKPVIMKLRDGSVYVGIIDAWTRKPYRLWYTEYAFTLRRIAYEDYIDDTT